MVKICTFISIFVLGLVFVFLVPPFQKPDEYAHFERALMISKGYLFCPKRNNNTIHVEKKYNDLISDPKLHEIISQRKLKLGKNEYVRKIFGVSSDTSELSIDHLCNFPIISYSPQAFGLLLANLLSLNAYLAFFLGRFTGFLFMFVWMIILFRKTVKPIQMLSFAVFSLPMTLHQLTSYSYDAVHIMLALTLFNYLFIMMKNASVSLKSLVIWFILLLLFMLSKTGGYEIFTFFIFLLPFGKVGKKLFIFLFLIGIIYTISRVGVYQMILQTPYSQGIQPSRQLSFLLSQPFFYLIMLAKTTILRFTFYAQSMIGIFGWLEYGLEYPVYLLFILFFTHMIMTVHQPAFMKFGTAKLLLLFALLVLSYSVILTINYLFWTPYRSPISDGTQGRYFIPFLPFVLIFLINLKQRFLRRLKVQIPSQKLIFLLVQLYILYSITHTIINRFYY